MSFNNILIGRECISCGENPSCNCGAGQRCVLTSRTCSQCPQIQCLKNDSASGGGVNPGVIAGPVVAVLVIVSGVLFWWLRRKKRRDLQRLEQLADRARKAESAGFHLSNPTSPSPASASGSLASGRLPAPPSASRRSSPLPPASVNAEYLDENGATVRVYGNSGTINLDPTHPDNGGDPFSDRQSISTAATSTHSQSTNIIPIQYIPSSSSKSELSHASTGGGGGGMSSAQAARTLDQARQNLLKPSGAPQRPTRSGDATWVDPRSPGGGMPRIRDSYVSDNSGAPSWLSGNSYDVHNDAPKIITSRQVHVGRYQQAEVVQMGGPRNNLAPSSGSGGAGASASSSGLSTEGTDESGESGWQGEDRSPSPAATFGVRALAPSAPGYGYGYGAGGEEGLLRGSDDSPEPPNSTAGSTDLRFSMGSLAYRDSMSSMGTLRYLAQPDPVSIPHSLSTPRVPGPSSLRGVAASGSPVKSPTGNGAGLVPNTPGTGAGASASAGGARASTFSDRSYADSVLSGFPMIPPPQPGSGSGSGSGQGLIPRLPSGALPQSFSTNTLDGQQLSPRPPPRPPIAYKPPPPPPNPTASPSGPGSGSGSGTGDIEQGGVGGRPLTQTSMADSFLGSFPFVPPNMDDLAELPSAELPTAAVSDPGKDKRTDMK